MLIDVVAKSGEAAKSGPIGFAVILVLCVVCYFLFKSMSKHLRKVREQELGESTGSPATAGDQVDLVKRQSDQPPTTP
jgi:hypothetical protein